MTIASPLLQIVLAELGDTLRAQYGERLRWVRLFGSWARGTATEHSDVDVAVVIDALTAEEWRRIFADTEELERRHDCFLSLFVMATDRFEGLRQSGASVANDILEQGIVA